MTSPHPYEELDDPDAALRQARQRFVSGFLERCSSFGVMIDTIGADPSAGPVEALAQSLHRAAGLGGTIGLPTVSARARALEGQVRDARVNGFDPQSAHSALQALRDGFEVDIAAAEPEWSIPDQAASGTRHVLLVEDDPVQRLLVVTGLRTGGYMTTGIDRGELALATARTLRPDIVLLDISLPEMDGFEVCRQLKSDPDLHGTPILFMSGRAGVDDRLNGLALGADDYISKPVQIPEVLLRMELVLRRRSRARDTADLALTYHSFVGAAKDALRRGGAVMALVHMPRDHAKEVLTLLAQDLRRRDLIGRYDEAHVILLFPELTAAEAAQRVATMAAVLSASGIDVFAGIAASTRARTFRQVLDEADERLAEARYLRQPVVYGSLQQQRQTPRRAPKSQRTVLIAEDDPDVMRILDSQLKAAGYQTIVAFDGEQALDAIREGGPDVVLLDLMMPKKTGFDVLTALSAAGGPKPKVVVLSGRGREADVTRAFALGAEDYVTKPFSPDELVARLRRLTR